MCYPSPDTCLGKYTATHCNLPAKLIHFFAYRLSLRDIIAPFAPLAAPNFATSLLTTLKTSVMTKDNTPLPDPADTPAPPATDTPSEPLPVPDQPTPCASVPQLSLWELMRKDVDPEPEDATSRVLTNPRPSIWDL